MENNTLWERAESACYNSDIDGLTVKHIDLMESFAKAETEELRTALDEIHRITSSGLGLECEYIEYNGATERDLTILQSVARAFGEIYKIAHAECSSCTTHADWKELKYRHIAHEALEIKELAVVREGVDDSK